MLRPVAVVVLFAFALQASQAQTFSRGMPASVTSPTPDGQTHGVPASVVSPTPRPPGINPPLRPPFVRTQGPLRRFGNPHGKRSPIFVPVPLFYSYYTDPGYPSVADPTVPDPAAAADPAQTQQQQAQQQPAERSDDDLRAAYLQGARDALAQKKDDSRYGEHFMDSRERDRQQPVAEARNTSRSDVTPQPPQEDKTPPTVFIFKDGHQLETKNYAIMGETLFDFSGTALKKIKMVDIDTAATVKANDDRGVLVKLQ
jgi:hypothetical protein